MADKTSTQVNAAIEGTRVSGHAIHGGYFNVPIFTRVAAVHKGILWVGGTPAENPSTLSYVDGTPMFDKILCLYPWGEYKAPEGTEKVSVKLYDSVDQAMDQVEELANQVLDWLKDGKEVLVHCQAGLNRSNLIAARTLMLAGDSADMAIEQLRLARCDQVLCNQHFVDYLRSL